MTHFIYFIRNPGEYRSVIIKDGRFRIMGMMNLIGKAHSASEFSDYFHQTLAKGWRKVDSHRFYDSKFLGM